MYCPHAFSLILLMWPHIMVDGVEMPGDSAMEEIDSKSILIKILQIFVHDYSSTDELM